MTTQEIIDALNQEGMSSTDWSRIIDRCRELIDIEQDNCTDCHGTGDAGHALECDSCSGTGDREAQLENENMLGEIEDEEE